MAKWQDRAEKRAVKEEMTSKKGYRILVNLFEKYNVDFTKKFKITNWGNKDKIEFKKGMKFYGYEKLISKYE
ncbi:hypothetical protein [Lederbergia lenta]|uniref:hypothetical protein n=1 Tax=Lederbergia lenta TaxID=1467 RepID=UPI00203A394E|nr:hypothetical protein [Lederbergia lenta]MCM3110000.1 hypothetical protein [Lederbergia lenta]